MCPLRLILVFLSATLAGYFAWKSIRSPSPPPPISMDASEIEVSVEESRKAWSFDARKMISDGFLVFLDMASGRYLWKMAKGRRGKDWSCEPSVISFQF